MGFLHDRPLSPEELELIRRQVEEGAEVIAAVDDEIRGIVARNWPHFLAKLPPEEKNVLAVLKAEQGVFGHVTLLWLRDVVSGLHAAKNCYLCDGKCF